jgi:hypothetical protein
LFCEFPQVSGSGRSALVETGHLSQRLAATLSELIMTNSQSHWISATTKQSLSGEYYHMYDGRTERQVFSQKRWYDDDPARTKRLFLELRSKIMMKYPSWNAGPGIFKWGLPMCQESNPEIFDETDPKKMRLGVTESLPLLTGELPPVSAYRRPAPAKGLSHFDRMRIAAPSLDNLGSWPLYHFVSASWKAAIETVESGVHEFHPLEVRFTGASFHHFIFRPMHFGRPINYALSDAEFDGDRPLLHVST